MPLELARRLGAALDVKSETRIRQIDRALQGYVRFTPQSPGTSVPGAIDASQVISGEFDDGRISESSVTQHEGALEIDWLQLTGVPTTFTPAAHNHNASDINAGTLGDGRVAQSNVTQHQAALSIAWSQLTGIPSTFTPAAHLTWGAWTPVDAGAGGISYAAASGTYVEHEELVIAMGSVTFPATADANHAIIGGLPYRVRNVDSNRIGVITYTTAGTAEHFSPIPNQFYGGLYTAAGATVSNATMSGKQIYVAAIYRKA